MAATFDVAVAFAAKLGAARAWQLSRRFRPGAPHPDRAGGAGDHRAQDRPRRLAALSVARHAAERATAPNHRQGRHGQSAGLADHRAIRKIWAIPTAHRAVCAPSRRQSRPSWPAAVFTPHGDTASWLSTSCAGSGRGAHPAGHRHPAQGRRLTRFIAPSLPTQISLWPIRPRPARPIPQMIDAIPYAVGSFSLEDVQPAASVDFTNASHAVAKGFDGLLITRRYRTQGQRSLGAAYRLHRAGRRRRCDQGSRRDQRASQRLGLQIPAEKGRR